MPAFVSVELQKQINLVLRLYVQKCFKKKHKMHGDQWKYLHLVWIRKMTRWVCFCNSTETKAGIRVLDVFLVI